ncbi:DUF1295 domain-containing protein [Ketobacter sp.]
MTLSPLVLTIVLLLPVFLVGWYVQQLNRNAGWVDVMWAFGIAIVGCYYCLTGSGDASLRLLVAAIYSIWFIRLGRHLARRVHSSIEEDSRYAWMRQWAGGWQGGAFLLFYLMQASWVWLFTLPAWVLAAGSWPPSWCVWLALAIAVLAWAGESLADHQLEQFKADPSTEGKTCRRGLWRYSRHPNYFFEWCHWFVYPLLGWAAPYGTWLWLAPVAMFIFLFFVTGIPFTERQAVRKRGDDYRRYQSNTSMFFPWFTSAQSQSSQESSS